LDERASGKPRPIIVSDEQPLITAPPERLETPYAFPLPRPPRTLPENSSRPDDALAPPPALRAPGTAGEGPAARLSPSAFSLPSPQDGDAEPWPLLRLLHDRDPHICQAAELALRQRGFEDRHLLLARRLTDPDPQQRIVLAALLPRVPDLDPRPWLVYLSRDADERVRRAALAVMTATRDPALLELARQADK
jgi:HEAT repeat protein